MIKSKNYKPIKHYKLIIYSHYCFHIIIKQLNIHLQYPTQKNIIQNIIYFLVIKIKKISKSLNNKVMSQATQRTHKLLILAGDEGPNLQARDFKKLTDVIVHNYIQAAKQTYDEYLLQILPTVIRRVPLKQHMYAGLTSQILKIKATLGLGIIKEVAKNLQKDLSNLKLHESINGILFLSQLMNLQQLNSQCFLDLVDDIVTQMQKCKNLNHKAFFILVFSRTLYNYCHALNKKVYFEFKKLLQRSKKYCVKNIQFMAICQAHQKGTLNDGSIIYRIYQSQLHKTQEQIQQDIKLKIALNDQQIFVAIEYHLPTIDQSDKLYQQFIKNQGQVHLTNIQQIIQLMRNNNTFMMQKLLVYINGESQKNNSFIQRFFVDIIIGKGLKSKRSIIQSAILVKLIKANRVYAGFIETALENGLKKQCQNYDLGSQIKFTQIVSYIVNCWPSGNQMTDIRGWDWDKFVSVGQNAYIQEEQNVQKNYTKQTVLLKIICHKILLLNDNFKVPACLKKYAPPQELKNPTKYKQIQQIQILENFQELLKQKSKPQGILPNINSQNDYEIFLQALFEKTSQSHTHLQVLLTRYEKVFEKYKQDYDWVLLNTIRSFWMKSLFHRLFYLQTIIERGFVDFDSYVKYIYKVETSNEEEKHWVRLQLNQLLNKFGPKIQT